MPRFRSLLPRLCLSSGATVRLEWNCANTWTSVVVCNLRNSSMEPRISRMFVGGFFCKSQNGLLDIGAKLLAIKVHGIENHHAVVLGIPNRISLSKSCNPSRYSENIDFNFNFQYQFSSKNHRHFEVLRKKVEQKNTASTWWLKCGNDGTRDAASHAGSVARLVEVISTRKLVVLDLIWFP